MVKIRYSELPAGLHVSAEAQGRDTIIYLQPGLTPEQRRAALVRVRSSARMGCGPGLSATGMAVAVSADKLRTTVGNGVAAMRGHPLLLLPPLVLLVSGAIVFVMMSFVTLTVRQDEPASGPSRALQVRPGQLAHYHGSGPGPRAGHPAVAPADSGPGGAGGNSAPRPTVSPVPTSSTATSPVPVLSGVPSPSPSASGPSASPTPDPSPAPSQSQSSTCLLVGPLGICLHL